VEREKEIISLKNWIECLIEENKRLKSEINELLYVKKPPTQDKVVQSILFQAVNGPVTVNIYG